MKRTLGQMIASVQRAVPMAPLLEIIKALDTSNKEVQSSWEWPWLYKEYNVPILAPYTTGTVSVNNGATAVTGVGTTWNPSWIGMRLQVGSSMQDWRVASISSGTTLTLDQTVNIPSNLANVSYSLYQDSFRMPTDFDPGHDIFLGHTALRYRLKHIPRQHAEVQMLTLKVLYTTSQMFYCDDGWDGTGYRIRIIPPPGATQEYRLVYRKRPGDLDVNTETTDIPEPFDEIPELMAQWKLKEQYGIPTAGSDQVRAMAKIKGLKRQMANAFLENQSVNQGALNDSSISQWGMMINPYP